MCNEELYNLYPDLNIIRVIKSRMMIWRGHVVRVGEKRNACRNLRDHLEDLSLDGRMILKWIFKK